MASKGSVGKVAAIAAPEVALPLEAGSAAVKEATRLWGGLVDSLGKNAYESVTIRVGRKVVYKSRHSLGLTKAVDLTGPKKVVTTKVGVQRWELLPIMVLGAAAAGYALAETEKGQTAVSDAKNHIPQLWYGTTTGKLGEKIANFRGGIHIPY